MLSQGVPMLSGGDELGHTQRGNNNVYCQDNEISWYPWDDVDEEFVAWCRRVIAFRSAHPVFRRRQWFRGRLIRGIEDLAWVRPDGGEMTDDDWERGYARAVGVFVNGRTIPTPNAYGERIVDDSFLVLFNASDQDLPWHIPGVAWGRRWVVDLDTADPRVGSDGRSSSARRRLLRDARSARGAPIDTTTTPHPTINQAGTPMQCGRRDRRHEPCEVAAPSGVRPAPTDTGSRPGVAPTRTGAGQTGSRQTDRGQTALDERDEPVPTAQGPSTANTPSTAPDPSTSHGSDTTR